MAAVNAYSVVPHLEWSDHDLALFFTWDAPAPLARPLTPWIQHWETCAWGLCQSAPTVRSFPAEIGFKRSWAGTTPSLRAVSSEIASSPVP